MKNKLGQHFLTDSGTIKKIIEALNLKDGEVLIEIGPGNGELTRPLLLSMNKFKKSHFFAIEKDRNLYEKLEKSSWKTDNLELVPGDVLKELPKIIVQKKLEAGKYKIVGNIPYYISGYLFRVFEGLKKQPEKIVLTIQKEVAERVCAKPPKMNLLAASVLAWAEPKIIAFVPKKYFKPKPKVDSAVIELIIKKNKISGKKYYDFIKILFKQPRKTVLNNLKNFKNPNFTDKKQNNNWLIEKIVEVGAKPGDRPQNLTPETIKRLAEMLYN